MLLKKLFRTARSYKAQFISMIIMVAIGVGVFLGFNIEWKSIEEDVGEFLEQTAYADYRLYSDTGFTADDIEKIRNIEGVDAASRCLSVNVDLKDTKKSVALDVVEDYEVSIMTITEGEAYSPDSEGIYLSDKFAEANGIGLGDELTLTYKGVKITAKVVALAKSGEHMICLADSNQVMPDYDTFGFAYISPHLLKKAVGLVFYPQINLISALEKKTLEAEVNSALGKTVHIVGKEDHVVYKEAMGEAEEGKTMGSILPVLFLAIAVLTMATTMHRIAAKEKTQIGTLKALGFRDRRIMLHYTSYGFVIGLIGTVLGILLGYAIAALIMSPNGMMGTYFDMPEWKLVMPGFCIPVIILTVAVLTAISLFSVRKMLKGTAAETLRPYSPKRMKKSFVERLPVWQKLSFGTKWNFRDLLRHKNRSAMTLIGIVGCMILLVGGLGMRDTLQYFMKVLDEDVSNYHTKINLTETADKAEALALAEELDGDYESASGVSFEGDTVVLEIYGADHDLIRFPAEKKGRVKLGDDGVYLCMRLADRAKVGEEIEFSPYGSDKTYRVRVAGYFRSVMTESIAMTARYADKLGIDYRITAVYTNEAVENIPERSIISGKQDKKTLMDTYDKFMDLMDMMIVILMVAAIVLGIVVLYNLGVMSYVERSRELATLKVLGFRDKRIGRLLIGQNLILTVIGVLIGLPAGVGVLQYLIKALAGEYELKLTLGVLTYSVSILLTFGVSIAVSLMVAAKSKKIDMVEALKIAE